MCSVLACSTVCQLFPLTDWGGDPDGALLVLESSQPFTGEVRWAGKDEGPGEFGMLVLNTMTPAVGCTPK